MPWANAVSLAENRFIALAPTAAVAPPALIAGEDMLIAPELIVGDRNAYERVDLAMLTDEALAVRELSLEASALRPEVCRRPARLNAASATLASMHAFSTPHVSMSTAWRQQWKLIVVSGRTEDWHRW